MPKKFSQFISITIILFVFFLLLIIVGGIFLTHKEALKNEFANLAKAEQIELNSELNSRFNIINFIAQRISKNNAIISELALVEKSKLQDILTKEYPNKSGLSFFIQPANHIETIPALPNKLATLASKIRQLDDDQQLLFEPLPNGNFISIFTKVIENKGKSKLGTAIAIHNIHEDEMFWRHFKKRNYGKILIKTKTGLKHLVQTFNNTAPAAIYTQKEKNLLLPLPNYPQLIYLLTNEKLTQNLLKFSKQLLSVCLLAMVLTLFLIRFIVSYIKEPLANLTQQAETIAKSTDKKIDNDKIPFIEFRQLGAAFNLVLDGLALAQEKLKIQTKLKIDESEKKFVQFVESTPMGLQFFEEKDNNLILSSSNPAARSILATTKEQLTGKTIQEVFAPKTGKEIAKSYFTEKAQTPEEWRTKQLTHELGDKVLNVSAFGIKAGLIAVMFLDITEQKLLETKLKQAEKMQTVGILAGGVAHDLNNIFSGLVSLPELLLLELPQGAPMRNDIETIKRSGEKAAAIVQDLLTLTRRGVKINNIININTIIEEILTDKELEMILTYHPQVEIKTNLASDLLNILGSATHISKSIINLISNAAEAMPGGGQIFIETENTYIDKPIQGYEEVIEGDYVVFKIADSGTGISSEDLTRIFEPFYTKKKMGRSGTGLGMAVVWGTVKDHNGYINVYSKTNMGTVISIYLPITRKSNQDESLAPKNNLMGNKEKILVIDDILLQRKIATRILEKLNYKVKSVESGELALEFLSENSVDLVVLDMIMEPGINGAETYKGILQLHPNQKAIIASGYSENEEVKEAQKMGAGEYIKKPYTIENLGSAVKNELKRK